MVKINKKIYGYIYKITNLVNGKIYIGQTVRGIKPRFQSHFDYSKTNKIHSAIAFAIKKYGKEKFIIEEIDVAYNQKELNLIEGVYMSWFKSLAPNGYNIKEVIDGKGKCSKETKEKMRIKANRPDRIEQYKNQGKKTRGKSRGGKSKYCGVNIHHNTWIARIIINNKRIHLGTFTTEEDAAKAKDIAEIKLNPDAILNFPELQKQYLNNEIIVNKCKRNKSNSNVIGVSFCNSKNCWRVRLKGFKEERFKEQIDAENYGLKCLQIRENNG